MLKLTECNYLGRLLKFLKKIIPLRTLRNKKMYICMQTHDNFQVGTRELIKVCQLIFFILVLMPNGPFSLTAYSSFCGWSIAGQPHPPSLPPPPKKRLCSIETNSLFYFQTFILESMLNMEFMSKWMLKRIFCSFVKLKSLKIIKWVVELY